MSFEDLPAGRARDLDLSDHTHAADVVDLITLEGDRALGCFSAMLCDSGNRGRQPVCLQGLEPGAAPDAMAELLSMVLPLVAQAQGSVLLARGRPGLNRPTDDDRRWHEQAIRACREHDVRLLGFHVATPNGVVRLPDPLPSSDVP
jgi:hypothetical protein